MWVEERAEVDDLRCVSLDYVAWLQLVEDLRGLLLTSALGDLRLRSTLRFTLPYFVCRAPRDRSLGACGDSRVPEGVSGALLPDERGMRRCLNGERGGKMWPVYERALEDVFAARLRSPRALKRALAPLGD
jgi:hypothetical protein